MRNGIVFIVSRVETTASEVESHYNASSLAWAAAGQYFHTADKITVG